MSVDIVGGGSGVDEDLQAGLSQALAGVAEEIEWIGSRVHVTSSDTDGALERICPGYVATDMTVGEDEIPRHEMSQPADIAGLVATALSLPDNASVSELLIHCQFEPML